MTTKYYIDTSGNYMHGWDENHPDIDENWIEISAPPPLHATQTTADSGTTWSAYP